MKSSIGVLSFFAINLLLFSSCSNSEVNQSSELITIDLESMVDQQKTMGLAEIAKSVKYIPLETLPEAMLNPSKLLYVNKMIYILNRSGEVYIFNEEGKFVRQIGTIGKGPGEHIGIQYMEVSSDGSLIYLYSTKNRAGHTYKLDGEHINTFRVSYYSWWHAPLKDGRHVMISPYGAFSADSANFLFYIQDDKGKVVRKYPSTQVIKMTGDFSIGSFFIDPLRVLAYQPFCDTIFQVDGEGDMIPAYHMNYGSHRAPDELYADMANVMSPKEPYFLAPVLRQTRDNLFIRIRQLKKYHIGMYRFDEGDIFSVKTDNGKIPNDMDGGLDFWPSGSDGDKVLYRMIQPIDMLNPEGQSVSGKIETKDTKASEEYQKLLSILDENDNPVVMVVELK